MGKRNAVDNYDGNQSKRKRNNNYRQQKTKLIEEKLEEEEKEEEKDEEEEEEEEEEKEEEDEDEEEDVEDEEDNDEENENDVSDSQNDNESEINVEDQSNDSIESSEEEIDDENDNEVDNEDEEEESDEEEDGGEEDEEDSDEENEKVEESQSEIDDNEDEEIEQNENDANKLNTSTDSPKPEFQLSRDLVNGTILTDLTHKKWRIGKPIGKGSFGEIFLASDEINYPVTNDNAKYVVKIEPHSNGPLFVEIHCLLNTSKVPDENNALPPGIPEYIASGSHNFRQNRYRFLILPRFDRDLHSIIKNSRVDPKSILILAYQILEVLERLHDKGYCHSDIKAENLMIGRCTYQHKPASSNKTDKNLRKLSNNKLSINKKIMLSGSDSSNHNDSGDDYLGSEHEDDESEECISSSDESNPYQTPVNRKKGALKIQYSGSNPVRSCRTKKYSGNSIYQEMVNSHYLRPTKKINYSAFFDDDLDDKDTHTIDDYIKHHRLSNNFSECSLSCLENTKEEDSVRVTEDRIFLIDYGLALKFLDSNGAHRPFCMDQRRAHDGTLEFTSRDAHMGAHSRRSDLECLGYNLIFWSQGYLPWKDKAAAQKKEKVHWMKEYLMTDVREMLKHLYGPQVPKYLGDYMHHVNKMAYDERPQYEKLRELFRREYERLTSDKYDVEMVLRIDNLIKNSVKIKKSEVEKNNNEIKNIKNVMKNLGVLTPPFREIIGSAANSSSRVSPKNLRSKSSKNSRNGGKQQKNKKKKFSWTEILSQDPDQIARERAEKEFDREQSTETPVIRYSGKPTYAILEIQNLLKSKDRSEEILMEEDTEDFHIQGYTKPMMDIIKKKQATLFANYSQHKQQQKQFSITETPITSRKYSKRFLESPIKRGHQLLQQKSQMQKPHLQLNKKPQLQTKSQLQQKSQSQQKPVLKQQQPSVNLRSVIPSSKRSKTFIAPVNVRAGGRNNKRKSCTSAKKNSLNSAGEEFSSTDESSSCSSNATTQSSARDSICSKEESSLLSASSPSKRIRRQNPRYLEDFVSLTRNHRQPNVSDNSNCSSSTNQSSSTAAAVPQSYPGSLSDDDTRDMFDNAPPLRKRGRPLKNINIIRGTAAIIKNVAVSRRKNIPTKRKTKGEFIRYV